MTFGTSIRTRSDRAASLKLPPGRLASVRHVMQRRDVLLRIGLGGLTILLLVVATRGWAPPFAYRSGYFPPHDVVARTAFAVTTERHTEHAYSPGDVLARHRRPLSTGDIRTLHAEHNAMLAQERLPELVGRAAASAGVFLLLLTVCGWYVQVHQRDLWHDVQHLSVLAGAVVLVVVLALLAAHDGWRAESVPLILFGLGLTVALGRPTGLFFGVTVALVVALALGQGLPEHLLLASSLVIPVLMLNRIRTRTKLIQVGVVSGLLVFLLAISISGVAGQAFGAAHWTHVAEADEAYSLTRAGFAARVVAGAAWQGLCVVLAGFLMTGLLPFLERACDVQTDIRLLELGDAAHPLLQQLAQRAPGTYNHSINVGSIGEAAAEAIGANGLLVRVGAYFHDIGKMFKPEYFIENQSAGNQHDSLAPAMSTLVIIAHVKDGVNLARQHRLPKSIIDFIQQHHGTTLVEYFYRQAVQREGNAKGTLDESGFRYPGPKPRTREAAVLMMADGVESACRSLTDPTPARIESLVHDIALKRLLDGQFEACGLTLSELHTVQERLVKSLTAVYHGRVKYPGQQTA